MTDIKITLSTDPRSRAPSIEQEAGWVKRERTMRYPLNSVPRFAAKGSWVYFIRSGKLVARAEVVMFERPGKPGRSYKGVAQPAAAAGVKVRRMVVLQPKRRLSCRGFQGFRYLTIADRTGFPHAFRNVRANKRLKSTTPAQAR